MENRTFPKAGFWQRVFYHLWCRQFHEAFRVRHYPAGFHRWCDTCGRQAGYGRRR